MSSLSFRTTPSSDALAEGEVHSTFEALIRAQAQADSAAARGDVRLPRMTSLFSLTPSQRPVGSVIMTKSGRILAESGDCSRSSHVLQHAALGCIEQIAQRQLASEQQQRAGSGEAVQPRETDVVVRGSDDDSTHLFEHNLLPPFFTPSGALASDTCRPTSPASCAPWPCSIPASPRSLLLPSPLLLRALILSS